MWLIKKLSSLSESLIIHIPFKDDEWKMIYSACVIVLCLACFVTLLFVSVTHVTLIRQGVAFIFVFVCIASGLMELVLSR